MIRRTTSETSPALLPSMVAATVLLLAFAPPVAAVAEPPAVPPASPAAPPPVQPRPVEVLALVGTASSDACAFALFSGNCSEFRIMAAPGEQIAGYTVRSVGFDRVRLGNGSDEIELPIFKELRRENGGPWRLANREESYIPREAGPAGTATTSGAGAGYLAPLPTTDATGKRTASNKQSRKLDQSAVDTAEWGKSAKRADDRQFAKKVDKYMRRWQ